MKWAPLGVLAVYLAFCGIVTWPLALHFAGETLGPHYADRMQNMWNLWWVAQALLDRRTNPLHTDLLFYPRGADLYYHTLNLPSTLLTLLPTRLAGVVVAYNLSVLAALLLAATAGYRLAAYAGAPRGAALVGGIVVAFNPLTQVLVQGQVNAISLGWCVLCMEAYLRAWDGGRRRAAALMGLCFGLAVLTVGYYETYLLLFFALHLAGVLWRARGAGWRARAVLLRRAAPLLGWGGGIALLVAGPYALGAWLSLQGGQIIPYTHADLEQTRSNSADLLSFVLPNRDGWLLGAAAPWWRGVNAGIYDFTFLGPVTLALAALGVWAGRRRPRTWLWAALAALGVVLALGPILQVNGQYRFGGGEVPLPFSLLRLVPPFDLVRVPFRFSTLTWIGLGVLAAGGVSVLLAGRTLRGQAAVLAGVLALLLLEMPLQVRPTRPLDVPASLRAVGRDPAPGALLELPITQHGGLDAPRMLYQIVHGRPITGGYLSRSVIPPDSQACSPFNVFSRYPRIDAADIITPTAAGQMPALLAAAGVGFLAVYKWVGSDVGSLGPLPAGQLAGLQSLAARLGTRLADDPTATTYRVRPAGGYTARFLQLGPAWQGLEQSGGQPFRWMDGSRADFCVFSPAPARGVLTLQVTSFATPRHLQVWLGDRLALEALVPTGGALHTLQTPALAWPAGPQLVRLVTPESGASPAALGQGGDTRLLGLGFGAIRWGAAAP